jgi:anti-sigma regulatory factor (Ser/Thr protein kinase)
METPAHVANEIYSRTIASSFEALMPVLDEALEAMRAHGCIPPGKEPQTRLCLEEALVNAVRHGNCCEGDREIRVMVTADADRCTIKVCDEGRGFSPDAIELPAPDTPGGRGICLIRHFMDEVRFDRENKCFVMAFKKALTALGER